MNTYRKALEILKEVKTSFEDRNGLTSCKYAERILCERNSDFFEKYFSSLYKLDITKIEKNAIAFDKLLLKFGEKYSQCDKSFHDYIGYSIENESVLDKYDFESYLKYFKGEHETTSILSIILPLVKERKEGMYGSVNIHTPKD